MYPRRSILMLQVNVITAFLLLFNLGTSTSKRIQNLGGHCESGDACVVENSECVQSRHFRGWMQSICECSPGFGMNTYTSCEQQPTIGESCNMRPNPDLDSERCNTSASLVCVATISSDSEDASDQEGICGCRPNSFWSSKAVTCVPTDCAERMKGLAWQEDIIAFPASEIETDSSSMTDAPLCWLKLETPISNKNIEERFLECPPQSKLQLRKDEYDPNPKVTFVCECDPKFIPSSDIRRCIEGKSYQESCSSEIGFDDPCTASTGLTCSKDSHLCECRSSAEWSSKDLTCYSQEICQGKYWHSFYDPDLVQCIVEVNRACTTRNGTQIFNCPVNAACQRNAPNNYATCTCNDGLISTKDLRKCVAVKSNGEACGEETGVCNPSQRTSCQNGTCVCLDGSIWDATDQKCCALPGAPCGIQAKGMTCIGNSYCNQQRTRGIFDICQCNGIHQEVVDRKCFTKYLGSCKFSEPCTPGTICINKVCICEDPIYSIFNAEASKCVSLVGSSCGANGKSCVRNSYCVNDIFQCDEDHYVTFSRTCSKLLAYGQNCSDSSDSCNFYQGLACVNATCDCIDPHLEFLIGKGCVGKAGSPCGMLRPVTGCGANTNSCEEYFVQCEDKSYCNHGNGIARCDSLEALNTNRDTEGAAQTFSLGNRIMPNQLISYLRRTIVIHTATKETNGLENSNCKPDLSHLEILSVSVLQSHSMRIYFTAAKLELIK